MQRVVTDGMLSRFQGSPDPDRLPVAVRCSCRQKSPFTSWTSPPSFRSGSPVLHQELIDVRLHPGGRLARADGVENHDARIEATLRNLQPRAIRRWAVRAREMRFADEERRRRT